jgi:hypothetical protein
MTRRHILHFRRSKKRKIFPKELLIVSNINLQHKLCLGMKMSSVNPWKLLGNFMYRQV